VRVAHDVARGVFGYSQLMLRMLAVAQGAHARADVRVVGP
jgi:hypothetical protein